jgi:WD40 repeat protein
VALFNCKEIHQGSINYGLCISGNIDLLDFSTAKYIVPTIEIVSDRFVQPAVAFSNDGSFMAIGDCAGRNMCQNGRVRIISIPSNGMVINEIEYPPANSNNVISFIDGLSFSPDDKILAGALGGEQVINLWDVNSGGLIGSIPGYRGGPQPLFSFNNDGTIIAFFSVDNSIKLWDLRSQSLVEKGFPILTEINRPHNIRFSPDNKQIILAKCNTDPTLICDSTEIMIFDIETGKQWVRNFEDKSGYIQSLSFFPNQNLIISGNDKGNIIVWDLSFDSWIRRSCMMLGRNLTIAEWQQYLPNLAYHVTCPQFQAGE